MLGAVLSESRIASCNHSGASPFRIPGRILRIGQEQPVLQRHGTRATSVAFGHVVSLPSGWKTLRATTCKGEKLPVQPYDRRDRCRITRKRALLLVCISQEALCLAKVSGSKLEGSHVAQDDLRIQLRLQPQLPVNVDRLPIGGERLIEAVGGCQRDRMRVVENGRLAMDAAGKCDSLRDGRRLGRNGRLEIACGTLYPRLDRHTLQPLLRISLWRLMVPECFRLGEQLRRPIGVSV